MQVGITWREIHRRVLPHCRLTNTVVTALLDVAVLTKVRGVMMDALPIRTPGIRSPRQSRRCRSLSANRRSAIQLMRTVQRRPGQLSAFAQREIILRYYRTVGPDRELRSALTAVYCHGTEQHQAVAVSISERIHWGNFSCLGFLKTIVCWPHAQRGAGTSFFPVYVPVVELIASGYTIIDGVPHEMP